MKTYCGPVGTHDDFSYPITDEFVDGRVAYGINAGVWAIMSPEAHKIYGAGVGVGRGQRYRKAPDGTWIKIA